MSKIRINNLSHFYGKTETLKELNLDIKEGEIHCILGPSGCGKSTFLKCLAGFETPKAGTLSIDGVEVFKNKTLVNAEKRNIALVFQDHSLFPHMTIEKNISLGITDKKSAPIEVERLLKMVGLAGHNKSFPHELSGGEQQRIAIARAFAQKPSFILLDEPFSNLDPKLRSALRIEIKRILKANNTTAIFITHDREEAFQLGDRVSIISNGEIQQTASPEELIESPANHTVAAFLNTGLIFPEDQSIIESDKSQRLYVPNKDLRLSKEQKEKSFESTIESVEFTPYGHIYNVVSKCQSFSNENHCIRVFSTEEFKEGEKAWVNIELKSIAHFI